MRLLFDQNLSPRLVRLLVDVYPDCIHVHQLEMDAAPDTEIWSYAGTQGFTIVTKDADFYQRSLVLGAPPKVIWLRLGNCTVMQSAELLREGYIAVRRFHDNQSAAYLALSPRSG